MKPETTLPTRVLTTQEMGACDRFTIEAGTPGLILMERAGQAVVDEILSRFNRQNVFVLCGPGNNGGDGYVIARLLDALGWSVQVYQLGSADALTGDAKASADRWTGTIVALDAFEPEPNTLIVDALFGTGLGRDLSPALTALIGDITKNKNPVVAVDIPSGIHGDTGQIMGAALMAVLTVTFHRLKPGHLLQPGRSHTGEIVVRDIGILDTAETALSGPESRLNAPSLWSQNFPMPAPLDHKYSRGHVVILGGEQMTGAARLASRAARRIGAGLCTIATPPTAYQIYAIGEPGVLLSPANTPSEFDAAIADHHRNAVLIGPGAGINDRTRAAVLSALAADKAVVLDADSLTVFTDEADFLFKAIKARQNADTVLTPHSGEFAKLFPNIPTNNKLSAARSAAVLSGATILLKGSDTVIASPNGTVRINANAPPDLATAGSGDVLAGTIVGLMAQDVDGFDAAAMAAWMMGEAATAIGPGLIAEDLPEALQPVIAKLRESQYLSSEM